MATVTINNLTPGIPSGAALVPYAESGATKSTKVSNFGVPVGAVFHLATITIPAGYLKCNGDVVPNGIGTVQGVNADFSALHAALGTTYGSAGQMPDLRGEFVRGFDDGRGTDAGRGFGTNQAQDWKGFYMTNTGQNTTNYSHNDVYMGKTFSPTYTGRLFTGYWAAPAAACGLYWDNSEIRPRNVALMAVIKY